MLHYYAQCLTDTLCFAALRNISEAWVIWIDFQHLLNCFRHICCYELAVTIPTTFTVVTTCLPPLLYNGSILICLMSFFFKSIPESTHQLVKVLSRNCFATWLELLSLQCMQLSFLPLSVFVRGRSHINIMFGWHLVVTAWVKATGIVWNCRPVLSVQIAFAGVFFLWGDV